MPPSIRSAPRNVETDVGEPFKVKIPFDGKGDLDVTVHRGIENITGNFLANSIIHKNIDPPLACTYFM